MARPAISNRNETLPIARGGWLDALRFIVAGLIILHHFQDSGPIPLAEGLHPVFERGGRYCGETPRRSLLWLVSTPPNSGRTRSRRELGGVECPPLENGFSFSHSDRLCQGRALQPGQGRAGQGSKPDSLF